MLRFLPIYLNNNKFTPPPLVKGGGGSPAPCSARDPHQKRAAHTSRHSTAYPTPARASPAIGGNIIHALILYPPINQSSQNITTQYREKIMKRLLLILMTLLAFTPPYAFAKEETILIRFTPGSGTNAKGIYSLKEGEQINNSEYSGVVYQSSTKMEAEYATESDYNQLSTYCTWVFGFDIHNQTQTKGLNIKFKSSFGDRGLVPSTTKSYHALQLSSSTDNPYGLAILCTGRDQVNVTITSINPQTPIKSIKFGKTGTFSR